MNSIINRIRNLKEKKEGARIIIIQSWRSEEIDNIWNLSDQNIEDLIEFYEESLDRLHSEKLRRGRGGFTVFSDIGEIRLQAEKFKRGGGV